MTHDDNCIFCRIIAGTLPGHTVYDDGEVRVLMDAFPSMNGHTLVVPHAHMPTLFDLDDATVRAVASATRRAALAIRTVLGPDGLTISQANGAAAGQTVDHYHVHLMPRAQGVRMSMHGTGAADADALATLAADLAAAFPPP